MRQLAPVRLKATRFQMVRSTFPLKALALLACFVLPAAAASADECRIAVLGDSLTAGYGVDLEEAFPVQLETALRQEGLECEVIDAGVSGDTSAGGRARLSWVLGDEPSHLIVELGGNDALRMLPIDQLEANLDAIVREAKAKGVEVLLAGMLAPPNLGRSYGDAFAKAYRDVAAKENVPLYPFFLDGAATHPDLIQDDGLHPNAAGVKIIVQHILPVITAWLARTGHVSSGGGEG
jgi:acyl-CoA thioesterase-1